MMAFPKTLKNVFLSSALKQSQSFLSLFVLIIIGILPGLIALLPLNGIIIQYLIKAFQLTLFFALGNLYTAQRKNLLKLFVAKKTTNEIVLISCLLCVLLSTLYIFFKKDILLAFSSSAAFMLPCILKICWHAFTSIPNKEFNVWFPFDKKVPDKISVSLNSNVVRLKILQHASDVDEKVYTVFVPHNTGIGDFFSGFLFEHNAQVASLIEDMNNAANKYAWVFFTTAFFGLQLRRIDPCLTMAENKIKKGGVIFIKRFMPADKLSFYNKTLLNETIK